MSNLRPNCSSENVQRLAWNIHKGTMKMRCEGMPPAPQPADRPSTKGFAARVVETVSSRGSVYGTPEDNHRLTAELWSSWLQRAGRLAPGQRITPEDVCMLNILQKISRLSTGTHDDSLLDISGWVENIAMLHPEQRNVREGGADGGPVTQTSQA